MPEIPEPLEDAALFAARQAQQQASPMQQAPWLSRLVSSVVQSTLELAVDHLKPKPVKLPDREALARELFVADNWNADREQMIIDFNDQTRTGKNRFYFTMADAAIEAFKRANS